MATIPITNLPAATSLTGSEEIPAVQAGTAVRVTASQIASLGGGGGGGGAITVGVTPVLSGTSGLFLYNNGGTLGNIAPTVNITDGTNTVPAATTVRFSGAVVSGSNPNALVTVATSPITVGSTVISGGTDQQFLYDNAGVLANQALPQFGTSQAGIVPASGGGTTKFLRADQTWAVPPGTAGSSLTPVAYSTNSATTSTNLTTANVSGGSVEHTLAMTGAMSAPSNMQLPTVTALVSAIGAVSGQSYKLRVVNLGGFSQWTITTNTGWTLNGPVLIDVGTFVEFYVTFNSSSTATLQSI